MKVTNVFPKQEIATTIIRKHYTHNSKYTKTPHFHPKINQKALTWNT